MLWIKAFHIVLVVCWFSGLFYLPRLFVYHAATDMVVFHQQFKIMEKRLYYGITWPSALLATILGAWLINFNPHYYFKAPWFHLKLALVLGLWGYHILCGYYLRKFQRDENQHTDLYYRWFNEVSLIFLLGIVISVIVKPWSTLG